jgi:hypothetical protein
MNAMSIVYKEERLLKRYPSCIANSYWIMGLVCNGDLSAMGERGGGRKNLTLKIYTSYVSSTKGLIFKSI